jgi:hypothetical protein
MPVERPARRRRTPADATASPVAMPRQALPAAAIGPPAVVVESAALLLSASRSNSAAPRLSSPSPVKRAATSYVTFSSATGHRLLSLRLGFHVENHCYNVPSGGVGVAPCR